MRCRLAIRLLGWQSPLEAIIRLLGWQSPQLEVIICEPIFNGTSYWRISEVSYPVPVSCPCILSLYPVPVPVPVSEHSIVFVVSQAAQAMLAHDTEESLVGTLSTMHLGSAREGAARSKRTGQPAHKEQPLLERARAAVAESPRFVLLDFRRVHGLDATAARTLGTLASTLAMMGVQLVMTQLEDEETARLLASHGVVLDPGNSEQLRPGAYRGFATLHDGMVFCETQYLKVQPFAFLPRHGVPLT